MLRAKSFGGRALCQGVLSCGHPGHFQLSGYSPQGESLPLTSPDQLAGKDTCNLLADGIVKLLRALAAVEKITVKEWAKARGYGRYLASSIKGEAAIDWSDKRARQALLAEIVRDADRLLELSRQAQGELTKDGEERQRIVDAAELLGQLLLQGVERVEGGVSLKDGVSKDRMMSVHDPEMRHGHKSSRRRLWWITDSS